MIDLQRSMIRLILLMITLNIALSFLETPQISRKVTGRCRALSAAATEVLDVIEIAVDAASATPALVQAAVPVVVPASVAAESVRMFSDPDAVRYFFAGGTCAGVSHGITVPIDVVKTRLQTDPDKYDDDAGIIGVAQRIIAEEGVGMLGRGLGPTVAGYCVQGAIKYGFYEALKPVVNSYFISHGIGDELGAITGVYKILALVVASSTAEMLGSSGSNPNPNRNPHPNRNPNPGPNRNRNPNPNPNANPNPNPNQHSPHLRPPESVWFRSQPSLPASRTRFNASWRMKASRPSSKVYRPFW